MRPLASRRPFAAFAALVLLAGLSVAGHSAEPADRHKEIADLEKQIGDLTKRLAELRKSAGTTGTAAGTGLDPAWLKPLTWRSIGPATMGGRITAISVFEADPTTYWVASASGGLLKTVNNGVTFEHQFDREATVSIGDVCVAPSDRNVVWVGTGEANPRNSVSFGDGVYRSTDGGKTWKNVGLRGSFQVGRVAVHPKDPATAYVGALGRLWGPNAERGLFKTTDGGKTWQKVLYIDAETGVIDVQMHPAEPDTLLVATWERRRDEFDNHAGLPFLPEGHDPYDLAVKWAPGTGIYKTTDGGRTWHRITRGLPTCRLGRIGLCYYRKDPRVVFAIVDSEKVGTGRPPTARGPAGSGYLGVSGDNADAGARLTAVEPNGPAARAGLEVGDIIIAADGKTVLGFNDLVEHLRTKRPGDTVKLKVARRRQGKDFTVTLGTRPGPGRGRGGPLGPDPNRPYSDFPGGQHENVQGQQGPNGFQTGGVYKSTDDGETWSRVNSLNPRPFYFSQVRVDPSDERYVYVLGMGPGVYRSRDGGKTFQLDRTVGNRGIHPDQHALWIDPRDGRHMLVGTDGGVYVTYDRTATWDFLNHAAIGQFYHVAVDSRRPYHVYGGLQDNGTWGGPSHALGNGGPTNDDWAMILGGDGFQCQVDPADPEVVYGESQDGFVARRNLRTGEFSPVRPRQPEGLPARPDWAAALLAPPAGPAVRWGWVAPFILAREAAQYRFNWKTPFILSRHNGQIFYSAGNRVFRSLGPGGEVRPISPEISRTQRGTGTALAESPLTPDVLYAGTDDGYLWVTRDGGVHWTNITSHVPLPGPRWVASIEASRFSAGRAYVAFDGHRSDDDEPHVFVTEDFGQSWRPLRANLPSGPTRVLREDVQNPDLLYLGTEFGIWCSLDRGQRWVQLNNNLPTVAVHEVAVHPTAGEIVAATHGRSLWVLDVTALRQFTPSALQAAAYLYQPATAVRWHGGLAKGEPIGGGARHFVGQNPPAGAVLYYSLAKKAGKASLKVVDFAGNTVRELPATTDAGLHKVVWDLMRTVPPPASGSPPPAQRGPRRGGPGGPTGPAPAGTYRVVLTVDGMELARELHVEESGTGPGTVITPEEDDG